MYCRKNTDNMDLFWTDKVICTITKAPIMDLYYIIFHLIWHRIINLEYILSCKSENYSSNICSLQKHSPIPVSDMSFQI